MPSSSRPYQSKILRFVLNQVQKGFERQQRAWQQIQSTAVWGAQVAVFPFYAMMHSIERSSIAINSDTDGHTTRAMSQASEVDNAISTILIHAQELLSPEQVAQVSIGQPQSIIPPTPLSQNISPPKRFLYQAQLFLSRLLTPTSSNKSTENISNQSDLENVDTTSLVKSPNNKPAIGYKSSQIQIGFTGILTHPEGTLASSIENRHLVVVGPNNKVFDILTLEQQTTLKAYIFKVMTAYWQSHSATGHRNSKQLSNQIEHHFFNSSYQPITTILKHTESLLSSRQTSRLSPGTPSSLVYQPKGILSRFLERLPIQKQLSTNLKNAIAAIPGVGHLISSSPSRTAVDQRVSDALSKRGYTLASMLYTRHLIVVDKNNQIFDIFTTDQQAHLKRYIFRVMTAYWKVHSTTSSRQVTRLSPKTLLTISTVFFKALPIEIKKAWNQISIGPKKPELPPLTQDLKPQPQSRVLLPYSQTINLRRSKVQRLSSTSPDAYEAKINDISYLEHPLERILRWIDRILTWLERLWHQWIAHISSR